MGVFGRNAKSGVGISEDGGDRRKLNVQFNDNVGHITKCLNQICPCQIVGESNNSSDLSI